MGRRAGRAGGPTPSPGGGETPGPTGGDGPHGGDDGGGDDPQTPRRIKIKLADGKERTIQHMTATTFWSPDGRPMSAAEFVTRLFGELPALFKDEDELRALWSRPDTRKALLASLGEKGFGGPQLFEIERMIDAEKSDLYDVLAYIAFALAPITREERVEGRKTNILAPYDDKLQTFLRFVLAQYVKEGVGELDQAKLPQLLELKYRTVPDAAAELGAMAKYATPLSGFRPICTPAEYHRLAVRPGPVGTACAEADAAAVGTTLGSRYAARMSRHCTICCDPHMLRRAAELIAEGVSDVAGSLQRHRMNHVQGPAQALAAASRAVIEQRHQILAAAEAGDDTVAYLALAPIVARLRQVDDRLERASDAAEQAGHPTALAALSGSALRAVDVRASKPLQGRMFSC